MYVEAANATDAIAITPSDSTIVNCDAIYVGTGGDIVVVTAKGGTVTYPSVPAGYILPQKCIKVMAATTASGLVGMRY